LATRVEIEEFVGCWLVMEPGERTRLGGANSRLGEDCMLGSSLYSVSDKFRVRVFVKDLTEFETLLPGSATARELADAIYLYLGFEYDWDLEIGIPAREIRGMSLGGSAGAAQGVKLGWTSWMASAVASDDDTIRTDARFHVVSRLEMDRAAKSRRN
jgi:type VI secretion system protein ImpH